MIQFLYAVFALLSFSPLAQAASCGGQTTQCYSPCDRGYVPVAGNTCEQYYDSSRRCYAVRGNCQDNGNGRGGCRGETETCYSACDRKYVSFRNADSCTTAYNSTRRCYEALGYCSK
jgi:hypothetical protein